MGDTVRLPATALKDRLRWLHAQRGITDSLVYAAEIVRLNSNLLARLEAVDASIERLIDLYESEVPPTPEHAAAWEEARNIMGRRA